MQAVKRLMSIENLMAELQQRVLLYPSDASCEQNCLEPDSIVNAHPKAPPGA